MQALSRQPTPTDGAFAAQGANYDENMLDVALIPRFCDQRFPISEYYEPWNGVSHASA